MPRITAYNPMIHGYGPITNTIAHT